MSTESIYDEDNVTKVSLGLVAIVKNISDIDLNNVKYVLNLPSEVSLMDFMIVCSTQNTNIYKEELVDKSERIIFEIPKIEAGKSETISFYINNNSMEYTKLSTTMTITSYAQYNDEIYNANDYTKKIYQSETKLEYNLTSNVDKEYVENGDEIEFTLNSKNVGFTFSELICAIENIPAGLEIIDVKFDNEDEEDYSKIEDEKIKAFWRLDKNEEQNLRIKTKVNENLFERDQSVIEFGMNISYANKEDYKTNIISYKIKNKNVTKYLPQISYNDNFNQFDDDNQQDNINQNDNSDNNIQDNQIQDNQIQDSQTQDNQTQNNNNTNNEQPKIEEPKITPTAQTYQISGLAWIDKNQDGIRQSEEKLKEAIVVSLYKSNNNGGIDTEKLIETTATNTQGIYTFSNVENGNYIIVFDYNSTKYKVTKYQVKTAKSAENSDAVSKTITINGNTQILGVTDVLKVENRGLTSIDIGLIDNMNFDLSMEKTISEVKVKNNEGTKVYNYQDGTNKRIEIHSKYYKSTVLDITYKFKVKNEGEVSGYINKIVDYLPDGVQVILNKSEGWYIGSDNGLYYTGLVDQEIKAGEEKEFTLVIRKSLEDGEAVKLVNGAEIAEATNSQGLYDKDSVENNKVKTEDDYDEVILTVSISTGYTIQYITTILIIIVMVAVILIMIVKFIKTKKVYR